MNEIVTKLKEWADYTDLPENRLAQVIGELGTIFRLTQLEEDFILEIEEN